ncbi:MAG: hypothetical protein KAR39_12845 [Thermoplasmata archaeon]|nr:hypothetical protein [Thermoplasmata archaeon]
MNGDEGEYEKKKDKTTKLEILTSPDQYEGKDTARHMSEMEELVKSSNTMTELVVRQLVLTRYRLSLIAPCEYCYDPTWIKENQGEFCCMKHELEDNLVNMDIDPEMWTRRTDTGDTAKESIELFYNNIVGDLMVMDSRLVWVLSEPPYNIIDKRDYSTEKLIRKHVWDVIRTALENMDMEEMLDVVKPIEEIVVEARGD